MLLLLLFQALFVVSRLQRSLAIGRAVALVESDSLAEVSDGGFDSIASALPWFSGSGVPH